MTGHSHWPAFGSHPVLVRRFLVEYLYCDLVPKHSLWYLDLMCDSGRAVLHVPSDNLGRLRDPIRQVLVEGVFPLSVLEKIVGKYMSMKVAIRPVSL